MSIHDAIKLAFLHLGYAAATDDKTMAIVLRHVNFPPLLANLEKREKSMGLKLFKESRLPPLKSRQRTMSAPPKMQSTSRLQSARVYSAKVRVPRAYSAMPKMTGNHRTHTAMRPLSGVPSLPEEPENLSTLDMKKTSCAPHTKELGNSSSSNQPNSRSSVEEARCVKSHVSASIEEETQKISLRDEDESKECAEATLQSVTNPVCVEETIKNLSEE